MSEVIITNALKIVTALIVALIGLAGTYLTKKLGENAKLEGICSATEQLIQLTIGTVDELQQTTVEALKAAHQDGKLTKDEIHALGETLIDKVLTKLSAPAFDVLNAAGTDITEMIHSAAEAYIAQMKRG